jgi:hypothetical protein
LDRISDLAAVELNFTESLGALFKLLDIGINLSATQAVDEFVPYTSPLTLSKPWVVNNELYPRLECLIECANPIRCQHQNPVIVLDDTKKNRDQRIPLKAVDWLLLQRTLLSRFFLCLDRRAGAV